MRKPAPPETIAEEHLVLHYRGRAIPCALIRKRVKNVNLRVRPDGSVMVSAAPSVPRPYIEAFLNRKGAWVAESIEQFARRRDYEKNAVPAEGAVIPLLGKNYLLRLHPVDGPERVLIGGGEVVLEVRDCADRVRVGHCFERFYKELAARVFQEALERVYPLVAATGLARPQLTVRRMKTRWGSCSRNGGRITINSRLLTYPEPVIDYVVLHELAHFSHGRHDKAFYAYLAELMPDWKERRKTLRAGPVNTGGG